MDGLPLGPNAVKVYVDAVTLPQTFLWRPTEKHSTLGDCLKSYVAWPLSRVSFDSLNSESPATESPITQSQVHTPPAPAKISKPVAQTPSSSRKVSSSVGCVDISNKVGNAFICVTLMDIILIHRL